VTTTDDVVEYEAHDCSGDVVHCSGRWNVACAGEHDWEIDVIEPTIGPALDQIVRNDRGYGADEEEVQQRLVPFEHVGRRYDAPDDRGSAKHSGA